MKWASWEWVDAPARRRFYTDNWRLTVLDFLKALRLKTGGGKMLVKSFYGLLQNNFTTGIFIKFI